MPIPAMFDRVNFERTHNSNGILKLKNCFAFEIFFRIEFDATIYPISFSIVLLLVCNAKMCEIIRMKSNTWIFFIFFFFLSWLDGAVFSVGFLSFSVWRTSKLKLNFCRAFQLQIEWAEYWFRFVSRISIKMWQFQYIFFFLFLFFILRFCRFPLFFHIRLCSLTEQPNVSWKKLTNY